MPVNPSVLSSLPLLSNLGEADINAIAQSAYSKSYAANETVLHGAVNFKDLIVVVSGQLQAFDLAPDGRLIGQSLVTAGHSIGWLSIVDNQAINIYLRTLASSELVFIPAPVARKLVTCHPFIAERVLEGFAFQIRRLNNERLALTQPNAFQRIFVHIQNLANEIDDSSKPISLPKQQEIASMANTSRETVSRAIQVLVRNGILKKHGHLVLIQKRQALEQLANAGPEALKELGTAPESDKIIHQSSIPSGN